MLHRSTSCLCVAAKGVQIRITVHKQRLIWKSHTWCFFITNWITWQQLSLSCTKRTYPTCVVVELCYWSPAHKSPDSIKRGKVIQIWTPYSRSESGSLLSQLITFGNQLLDIYVNSWLGHVGHNYFTANRWRIEKVHLKEEVADLIWFKWECALWQGFYINAKFLFLDVYI